MLTGKDLTFSYGKGTTGGHNVLHDISFQVSPGDFIGLIGTSGSGKTTLIKLMNGLLKADSGKIWMDGRDIYEKKYPISNLRKDVGLVFQYPEQQLFGKTVLSDTMFGPLNLGLSRDEAEASARESLKLVGIDESYYHCSPFHLSGGQKRCAAIAGVIAMQPKILILDEPAAGLDPETRHLIFHLIEKIQNTRHIAIILVSHHMEDVAAYAKQVWILHEGTFLLQGTPKDVFTQTELLKSIGIGIPQITSATEKLIQSGLPLDSLSVTIDEAEEMILNLFHIQGDKTNDS